MDKNALTYLQLLKNEIHSAVFATVDADGLPEARVIDIMLVDTYGLYFLTARGKAFYRQLMAQKYVAISGMTSGKGSLEKKAVSVRGKIQNIGSHRLDEIFEENPYMKEIYPEQESRKALEVFRLYEGLGEFFDLSTKPITRISFAIGKSQALSGGYTISTQCDGCGICAQLCPQKCIKSEGKFYQIIQENCLHCGLCAERCPAGAIKGGPQSCPSDAAKGHKSSPFGSYKYPADPTEQKGGSR